MFDPVKWAFRIFFGIVCLVIFAAIIGEGRAETVDEPLPAETYAQLWEWVITTSRYRRQEGFPEVLDRHRPRVEIVSQPRTIACPDPERVCGEVHLKFAFSSVLPILYVVAGLSVEEHMAAVTHAYLHFLQRHAGVLADGCKQRAWNEVQAEALEAEARKEMGLSTDYYEERKRALLQSCM